ncbi:MAG: hypothetical protein HZA93_29400 [Verrucomicrobia bacterium]|nr:hypothetical protein [Verrucomicrobiota bacterium]
MTPFYRTDARRAALLQEARSWLGTPFAENCAIKGPRGGVSCERYQLAVHTATGACPPVALASLPVEVVRHWHEHHAESLILGFLGREEVRGRVRRVDDGGPPLLGDLAIFRFAQTEHHLGLWCGHELLHVAIPAGVVVHSTRDPKLRAALRCLYRIHEAPPSALGPPSSVLGSPSSGP